MKDLPGEMTTFFLVRHAAHGLLDRVLVGRLAGVRLAPCGLSQAQRLAERLQGERITVVQSSPRERACETAEPIAGRTGLPLDIAPALDEIDMGEWTGRSFASLNGDPRWRHWNLARGSARPPGGESMRDVQVRVLRHLEHLHLLHAAGRIVLVSHAEAIRCVLLHFLGMPLHDFVRLELAPATISTVAIDNGRPRVVAVNERVAP
jgi:broad specificity phosphatase PhoE